MDRSRPPSLFVCGRTCKRLVTTVTGIPARLCLVAWTGDLFPFEAFLFLRHALSIRNLFMCGCLCTNI